MFEDGTSWPLRASWPAVLGSIAVSSQAIEMLPFRIRMARNGHGGENGTCTNPSRVVSAGETVFQMSQAKGAVLEMEGSGCRLTVERLPMPRADGRRAMMASKIGENLNLDATI